jgi:NADPH-dependent glutamate synthase beta subunit-like oxidoreductase
MDKPFAITLDVASSLANRTGNWRTERAEYIERLPPCSHACPADEDIQAWLYDAESGGEGYARAWRRIMETNPFPAVMGRVCYHPCETKCNRKSLDEAVGINSVERFLGDEAIDRGWTVELDVEPTGKRVLVIGAGPSGLSAAYHLRRLGHEVTIHEAGSAAGGMMRFGIPTYRLPREVLGAEIDRILAMGVELELDRRSSDAMQSMQEGDFDAVFLAVGAHIAKRAYVPAGEAARVLDAVGLLHDMEDAEPPQLGRRVVVYGGGDTAMDVYRRTRDRMPAHDVEVEEAEDEGVKMRWLSTVTRADEGRLQIERMELDEDGFPQPTGELEELEADSLILALGQEADLALLEGAPGIEIEDGVVTVGPDMMTGQAGIFAGGDMVPAERTVTVAIGHGRRAAQNIDRWLRGTPYAPTPEPKLADFDSLNTWYYADAPRTQRPRLETARRRATFEEVVGGLDDSNALYEARRCLSCGNCFGCDNCFGLCPDNAVIKLEGVENGYEIDLDYCKGCGICVAECPCGAIEMVPEEI